MMLPCVYIIKDKNNKIYIGSTAHLERRLRQHLSGHTKTTKAMVQPRIVFSETYRSLAEARMVERKLKSLKRRDYIEKIIKDGYIKSAQKARPSFNG